MQTRTLVVIILVAAVILYTVVAWIVMVIRAKKSGIITCRFTQSVKRTILYVLLMVIAGLQFFHYGAMAAERESVIADAKERGYTAFTEYEGWDGVWVTEGKEEQFSEWRIAFYTEKINDDRFAQTMFALAFVCWLLEIFLSGFYITKDGVYVFGGFKARKFKAVLQEDKICLYTEKRPDKPFYRYKNTPENSELLADFLAENEEDKISENAIISEGT